MHLLIPYVYLPGHEDPLFAEYTYADGAARARKMKRDLHKGDYVFFHTSFRGAKHITAYYIVDRVLDVAMSASDTAIRAKYRNPHLVSYINKYEDGTRGDDAILFGDPILSRILPRPLPFTRALGQKLAFNFKFKPGRTETQSIGSATRAWRSLTSKQVKTLLKQIARWDTHLQKIAPVRSSEEVAEVLERDIETYLASAPSVLGKRRGWLAGRRRVPERTCLSVPPRRNHHPREPGRASSPEGRISRLGPARNISLFRRCRGSPASLAGVHPAGSPIIPHAVWRAVHPQGRLCGKRDVA